jgi:hypothetical protein
MMDENSLEYCRYILDKIEETCHPVTRAQKGKEKYDRDKFLKKLDGIVEELEHFFPDGVDYNRIILEKADKFSKRVALFEKNKIDENMDILYKRMRGRLKEEREKKSKYQSILLDDLFEMINELCLISSNVSACKSDEKIIRFSTYDIDNQLLYSKIETGKNEIYNKVWKSNLLKTLAGMPLLKKIRINNKFDIAKVLSVSFIQLIAKLKKDEVLKRELEQQAKEKLKYQYFECVLEITKMLNDALKEEFCYVG